MTWRLWQAWQVQGPECTLIVCLVMGGSVDKRMVTAAFRSKLCRHVGDANPILSGEYRALIKYIQWLLLLVTLSELQGPLNRLISCSTGVHSDRDRELLRKESRSTYLPCLRSHPCSSRSTRPRNMAGYAVMLGAAIAGFLYYSRKASQVRRTSR